MRAVFSLVLIVGVGLAGFAVYMAKGVFGEYQDALAARGVELLPRAVTIDRLLQALDQSSITRKPM